MVAEPRQTNSTRQTRVRRPRTPSVTENRIRFLGSLSETGEARTPRELIHKSQFANKYYRNRRDREKEKKIYNVPM